MGIVDVLGINRRNIEYVFKENRRSDFVLVDDKVKTKEILRAHDIPHLPLLCVAESYFALAPLIRTLHTLQRFALKPARGFGGKGILVVKEKHEKGWRTVSDRVVGEKEMFQHSQSVLFGVFSIDSDTDKILVEDKITAHSFFDSLAYKGIPDIRIIVFRRVPVMAMLRLPTRRSDGKANLHAGGIGVGLDLETGEMTTAIGREGSLAVHPDTGAPLAGLRVPFWKDLLELTCKTARVFPLGYIGFDWVLDADRGPLVLELNARPGLEIQNANQRGLRTILEQKTAIGATAAAC